MIPDITAPQRKALAEVAEKDVTYVFVRNQEPEFKGARARRDVLEKLIRLGLIERGGRTNTDKGFTTPVSVTPLGRAVLAVVVPEENEKQGDES